MGLVVLILVMPYFYSIERDRIATGIAELELREIADYTSNTLANLYFLANSTNNLEINLTKQVLYLPLTIQDSFYSLSVTSVDGNASKITASLEDRPSVSADSWLIPGLKADVTSSVEIAGRSIIASCYRNVTDSQFYVLLEYGE
jgi:hypothetical protein